MKGIKGSTKRRDDLRERIDEIISLYKKGITAEKISFNLKTTKGTILKLLKINGVERRKPAPLKGRVPWNKGKVCPQNGGKNHWCWKGGVTPLNMRVRRCAKYRKWVKDILERDNWTCQKCGIRGGELEADHYPKKFAEIMIEIKSFEEAMENKELWNLDNGRTICLKCHDRTFKLKKLK